MIAHTEAYGRLKVQRQELFDFLVVASYAAPSLRDRLAAASPATKASTVVRPDNFPNEKSNAGIVLGNAQRYSADVARYATLAFFSFFEAYLRDAVKEVIAFHAGADAFGTRARSRLLRDLKAQSEATKQDKRSLQEPPKKGWRDRYMTKTKSLTATPGFRFPSELLAAYGVAKLTSRFRPKQRDIMAAELFELVTEALLLDLPAAEASRHEQIRKVRNDIAHGKRRTLTVKEALDAGADLFALAKKIDQHLVAHFLVNEEHA